mgnify:FL=1
MKEWQEPKGKIKSFTEQDLTEEENESLGFRNFFFCGQNLGQLKVFIFRTLAFLQSFGFHRAVLPGFGRAQGESYVFSAPI